VSRSGFRRWTYWLPALAVLSAGGCAGFSGTFWPSSTVKDTPPVVAARDPHAPGEGKPVPRGDSRAGSTPSDLQGNALQTAVYAANGTGAPANRPTVTGAPLNLQPGETLTERSLELARKRSITEEEKLALTTHAQYLRTQVEERDRLLLAAEKEVRAAADEVTQTRSDLQHQRQELGKLRERLRSVETDNAATLRSIITWLERVLESEKKDSPPERREPDDRELLQEMLKTVPKPTTPKK
jgi:hypothetical protein